MALALVGVVSISISILFVFVFFFTDFGLLVPESVDADTLPSRDLLVCFGIL
jgi:hypothetical protein